MDCLLVTVTTSELFSKRHACFQTNKKRHQFAIRESETTAAKTEYLGAMVTWRPGMFTSRSKDVGSKFYGTMCCPLIRFHAVTIHKTKIITACCRYSAKPASCGLGIIHSNK